MIKTKAYSIGISLCLVMIIIGLYSVLVPVVAQETPPDPLTPLTESFSGAGEWEDTINDTNVQLLSAPSAENAQRAPAQVPCDGQEYDLILNGGFEDSSAWYVDMTGDAQVEPDNNLPHSGDRSLALIGAADAYLLAGQTVVFPEQVDWAVLHFYYHQDRASSGDTLYVLVYDIASDELLGYLPLAETSSPGTWEAQSADFVNILADMTSQRVEIMFFAVMDDTDHTTYHVDDVSLDICLPSFCTASLVNNGFEQGQAPWLMVGDAVLDSQQANNGSVSARLGGYPGTPGQTRAFGLSDAGQPTTPTEVPHTVASGEAQRVPLDAAPTITFTPSLTGTRSGGTAMGSRPLSGLDHVSGTDSFLNPSSSQDPSRVQQDAEQVLQNPGFETGTWPPWYTYNLPFLTNSAWHSGTWSAHLGGYNEATDQFWQMVSVPADATEASFEFWYALNTLENITGRDVFCVAIWDSSGSPDYVMGCADFASTGGFQDWTRETYTLDSTELQAVAGKTVNFGFIVQTDVSDPSEAWVDDTALYITTPDSPPSASFYASPISGTAPLTVSFSDGSTGDITAWAWDFGDGASSTLQNPTHTYDTAGVYTATLTVTGPGGSDEAEQVITVEQAAYGYGVVSQAFTIGSDMHRLDLGLWLRAPEDTDSNDRFHVELFNADFSESLWGEWISYQAGDWTSLRISIPVEPEWYGQTVNLAFELFNDSNAPHSVLWVDDVTLNQCPEPPHVSNAFIRADVDGQDGTFVIGTTEGDPATSHDDDRNLLYGFQADGYSFPGSSFTTLRVVKRTGTVTETNDYVLDEELPVAAPHREGDTVITRWHIDGVAITQSLSLARNPHTNDEDMVQIAYEVKNWNAETYDVGLRSLLDVKIGDNDGAPYFVPEHGNLTHEIAFLGGEVPAYWKAFESPIFDETHLRGQGVLRGGDAVPPDRMVIANWPSLWGTRWDYAVQQEQKVTDDSAVALYWNPTTLYYAEGRRFATYYGLAGQGGGRTWLDAPAEVFCGDLEFDVVQWVNNDTDSTLTGGQSTLTLPAGVALVCGETADKAWPDIPAGSARSASWRVAATGDVTSTVTIQADATFDGDVTLPSAQAQVAIPRCETQVAPPTDLQAYPGMASINLRWQPSPSPGVEGYHVYRHAPGESFARITKAPVRTTYYQDNEALTEGTLYTYYVTAVADAESAPSNETQATFGQLSLSIPSIYATSGTTVTVPVNIANADELRINSLGIYLTYPTYSLTLMTDGVQSTPLSEGYAFGAREPVSGTVKVILTGGDANLHGQGTLLSLIFKVTGRVGTECRLHFDEDKTVILSQDLDPIPLSLQDGQVTIRRNFKLGDLDGDGEIWIRDVAIALRVAVGKIIPTEEQRSAGDVNGDQRNNSADAVLIMRKALGPDSQTRMAAQATTDGAVTLSVGTVRGQQGDTVWIPISIDDATQLAGGDLTLNYDPNKLTVSEPYENNVQLIGAAQAFRLEVHSRTPGVLAIALANGQSLASGSGAIVNVRFTIKRSAPDGPTPVTLSSAWLNDAKGQDFASALQRPVNVNHGRVFIGECKTFLPIVIRKH